MPPIIGSRATAAQRSAEKEAFSLWDDRGATIMETRIRLTAPTLEAVLSSTYANEPTIVVGKPTAAMTSSQNRITVSRFLRRY
jgi:hypothetical protein